MRILGKLCVMLSACVAVVSCGSTDGSEPDGRSLEAICAGAPRDNGDGTVTMTGCPFEQQADNIYHYGHAIPQATLFDATDTPLATVTSSCGSWWMGKDSADVTVMIDASGEVRSHGLFHQGMATSVLDSQVSTPLVLR